MNSCSKHRISGQWTESIQLSYLIFQIMNSEHLADSWIHGYLIYKIRLGALGWSNIEITLLESEFLDSLAQFI
jgi:hypothetical protein